MPRGGVRVNSGRPKGSKSRAAKLPPKARGRMVDRLVKVCAKKETSPMETMLDAMILFDEKGKEELAKLAAMKKGTKAWQKQYYFARAHVMDAVSVSKDLAPYIHAKLQAVTLKGDRNSPIELALGLRSAAELKALVRGGGKK